MGITAKKIRLFQSTPPVKAATVPVLSAGSFTAISIHAAREGGDACAIGVRVLLFNFNPRRP